MPEVDLGTYAGPVLLKLDAYPGVGTPDLSDPQGFGFALWWLAFTTRGSTGYDGFDLEPSWLLLKKHGADPSGIHARWLLDRTSDVDRLALARACEEVARG